MNVNPREVIEKNIIICDDKDFSINTNLDSKECQISSNGIDLRIAEDVTIPSKSFKNVQILERFNMDGVIGLIKVRSSFSRKGIFESSGLFDDGFGVGIKGGAVGGVSLYNLGEEDVYISKGTRICQMIFFKSDPAKKYNGFYNQNQTITSQFDVK